MDEKTEELRDIFMDVSEEETVTEQQDDDRGSLAEGGGDAAQIADVIVEMRDRYDFSTELADDDLVRVVRGYFDGSSDATIADDLGVARDTVVRARLDLHLLRDRDTEAPIELSALREQLDGGATTSDAADALDISESTVRRYRRVLDAQAESRRVSARFQSALADAAPDADLSGRMTDEATEDGLEDATEGMETNVSF
ncbi:conditioned medium-induced protein 4 [Halobacteriales archaeon QH_7_66_36]|nr:MAG: conditioned medium-induced protein 4 [Halobacteriales archaeon QH_7_66_36]